MNLKKCRNNIVLNLITFILSVGCFVYFNRVRDLTVFAWLIIATVDFVVLIKNIAEYIKLKKQDNQQPFFEKQE